MREDADATVAPMKVPQWREFVLSNGARLAFSRELFKACPARSRPASEPRQGSGARAAGDALFVSFECPPRFRTVGGRVEPRTDGPDPSSFPQRLPLSERTLIPPSAERSVSRETR